MQSWPSLLFPPALRECTYTESAVRWHFLQNYSAALSQHSDTEWAITSIRRVLYLCASREHGCEQRLWECSLLREHSHNLCSSSNGTTPMVPTTWTGAGHLMIIPPQPIQNTGHQDNADRSHFEGLGDRNVSTKRFFFFLFLFYTKCSGGSLRLNTRSNYRRVYLNGSAFN